MNFKINKTYKLKANCVEEFIKHNSSNREILNTINLQLPFTVLSLDNECVDRLKTYDGKKYSYIDFNLCVIIDKDEVGCFEEVKEPIINSKVILIMSTDVISKNSGVIDKELVDIMVKDFLTNNPDGEVEIYELIKTAYVEPNIIYK